MVEDAFDPVAAELAVGGAGQQCGILAGHRRLIAIAVQRPSLHLAFIQRTGMQQMMEWMLIVVALGPHGADVGLQFLGRKQQGQRVSSMPS
jgi:hypothetical protein